MVDKLTIQTYNSSHGRLASEGISPANSIPDPRFFPPKEKLSKHKQAPRGTCKNQGIYPVTPGGREWWTEVYLEA